MRESERDRLVCNACSYLHGPHLPIQFHSLFKRGQKRGRVVRVLDPGNVSVQFRRLLPLSLEQCEEGARGEEKEKACLSVDGNKTNGRERGMRGRAEVSGDRIRLAEREKTWHKGSCTWILSASARDDHMRSRL